MPRRSENLFQAGDGLFHDPLDVLHGFYYCFQILQSLHQRGGLETAHRRTEKRTHDHVKEEGDPWISFVLLLLNLFLSSLVTQFPVHRTPYRAVRPRNSNDASTSPRPRVQFMLLLSNGTREVCVIKVHLVHQNAYPHSPSRSLGAHYYVGPRLSNISWESNLGSKRSISGHLEGRCCSNIHIPCIVCSPNGITSTSK